MKAVDAVDDIECYSFLDVTDSSSRYLYMYEFETKMRLGNLFDVEPLLEKTSHLPTGQARIFENYASKQLLFILL